MNHQIPKIFLHELISIGDFPVCCVISTDSFNFLTGDDLSLNPSFTSTTLLLKLPNTTWNCKNNSRTVQSHVVWYVEANPQKEKQKNKQAHLIHGDIYHIPPRITRFCSLVRDPAMNSSRLHTLTLCTSTPGASCGVTWSSLAGSRIAMCLGTTKTVWFGWSLEWVAGLKYRVAGHFLYYW